MSIGFQLNDMLKFDQQGLIAIGFEGFISVAHLREGRIAEVSSNPGVYIVLREVESSPIFLPLNPAGWFKGRDPTVPIPVLEAKWVPDVHTLYVGKTHQGAGLRKRIKDLLDFGSGRPVAHWGGRYLWQVQDSAEFVIAWRASTSDVSPRGEDRVLLEEFRRSHGARLPFANLVG